MVATFGALAAGDRLSGLFLSNDGDAEIARSSPGELIVREVVRDAIARGFKTFDLGVGEARYKNEACEAEEPLFDGAFAATGSAGPPRKRFSSASASSGARSSRRNCLRCFAGCRAAFYA